MTLLCFGRHFGHALGQETDSIQTSLNCDWEVSIDDGTTWQPVRVPASIEDQIDVNFDGVSRYRRTVKLDLPKGQRAFLQFDAVATQRHGDVRGTRTGNPPRWLDPVRI